MIRAFIVLASFALVVTFSACGSNDSAGETSGGAMAGNTSALEWAALRDAVPNPRRLLIPTGPPPEEVVVRELKKGHGPRLEIGDSFTVNYVDFSYASGEQLEDRRGEDPFSWTYKPGSIVKGWVTGMKGMRVGGQRELIVPSHLAYDTGALVYVIELLKAG